MCASMFAADQETSIGTDENQNDLKEHASDFGKPSHGDKCPGLVPPASLAGEELRPVAEIETPTSRFYVGNNALCLVEAVNMTESAGIDFDGVLEGVERKLIKFALQKTGGARAGAARMMGISRSRLYRRLHLLGLDNGHANDRRCQQPPP